MRAQMALLKNKLENEALVNDKLLRSSMKDKLKKVRQQSTVTYVAAAATAVLVPGLVQSWGISIWLAAYIFVIMAVSVIFTLYYHRGLNSNIMNGSMVEVAKRMRKLHRDYKNWRYIGYPMGIIFVVWMFLEFCSLAKGLSRQECIGAAVGVLVGAVVGGVIGYLRSKQTMNSIEELIKDAEEFENNH